MSSRWEGVQTTADCILSGELGEIDLDLVFALLSSSGATGAVHTWFPEGGTASIWVHEGAIYGGSTDALPPLREALLRAGITDRDLWDAMDEDAPEPSLADVLAGAGADEGAAWRLVRERAVDALFEILVVGGCPFEVCAGDVDHELLGAPAIDAGELLADARSRLERWQVIASTFPSTDVVVVPAPAVPHGQHSVMLTGEEWRVLAALDGQRSIADVIGVVGLSAFDVCAALHELHSRSLLIALD